MNGKLKMENGKLLLAQGAKIFKYFTSEARIVNFPFSIFNFPLKSLILIFLLSSSVSAYTLSQNELNNTVLTKLNYEASAQLKGKDYKVTISNIPSVAITTNENVKPKIEIVNPNNTFNLTTFRKVVIKDSKNNIVKIIPITIQTKLYENVLVATKPISYGEEINSNNTQIIKQEVSKIYGKTYSNLENNLIASRNILKGNVILKNSVKQKAIITRNSMIDIVFLSNNGLKISLKGKALKDGSLGEKILVKSDKYNKIYNAIVQNEQSVIVRI